MRVVHVITRLIVGGAQENTLSSVRGLRQRADFEVQLWSGPTTGPEGSLELEARALAGCFQIIPSLVRPVHPWHDTRAWADLTRRFRRWRPDLVHTHSGKAGFLGRLAARRARVPVIVHTIHGPSFGPFQAPLANCLFRAAERAAARCTHHFVAVAEAMIRQYLVAGIGRPEQYTRIFSGFALTPFCQAQPDPQLRAQLGLTPDDFVVGKIARLFKLKGHDDLLAAAPEVVARSPRIRFLLVGDGAWRTRLEQAVARHGLASYFRFAGLVAPADVPRYIALMDVLVHLSYREGLPRALPQALAAGRPVLAYDLDGAPEVCHHGETGFLLAPGDPRGLAERLAQLEAEPALRQRLGMRGAEFVRAAFAEETMVESLGRLYAGLLGQPNDCRRT
jgi:glycosyltransferase involved in cell wall biosynthesis